MDVRANIVAQAQVESEVSLKSRLLDDEVGGKNECEQSECAANVTKVYGISPQFVIAPKDVYILSDEVAIIETRIYSVPKPIVRWYKNGKLITTAQFPKIKKHHYIPETYQLEIPNASASDLGEYSCIARNCYGSITASATLRIIDLEMDEPPMFLKRLKRTDILTDSNRHVTVTVTGVPEPKVEWFKNSLPLKENKRIEISRMEPRSYVLRFKNALPEDTGVYTCQARNASGTTSTSAMVYVENVDNLKKVWAEDVAISQLSRRKCPEGWSPREMDNHMYRMTLANYHIKYRPESLGYSNLF